MELRVRTLTGRFRAVEVDDSGADGELVAESVRGFGEGAETVYRDAEGVLFRIGQGFSTAYQVRDPAGEVLGSFRTRALSGQWVIEAGERTYVGRERGRWRRLCLRPFGGGSFFVNYDFHLGKRLVFTLEHEPLPESEDGNWRPDGLGLDDLPIPALDLDVSADGPDAVQYLARVLDPEVDVRIVLAMAAMNAAFPR